MLSTERDEPLLRVIFPEAGGLAVPEYRLVAVPGQTRSTFSRRKSARIYLGFDKQSAPPEELESK